MNKKDKIIIFVVLIASSVLVRLLPHPWNFSPVAAIALFSGAYLGGFWALSLPILIMLFSDLFLGFYQWELMFSVYLSISFWVLLGFWLSEHKRWYVVIGTSLFGSSLFFLVTNLAVWVFTSWYPKSLSGLSQCFVMALPFFKNALLGDLFYVATFFVAYEAIKNGWSFFKIFGRRKEKSSKQFGNL